MVHTTLTMPIWELFAIQRLMLDMAYLSTKFQHCSLNNSKKVNEDPKHKNKT